MSGIGVANPWSSQSHRSQRIPVSKDYYHILSSSRNSGLTSPAQSLGVLAWHHTVFEKEKDERNTRMFLSFAADRKCLCWEDWRTGRLVQSGLELLGLLLPIYKGFSEDTFVLSQTFQGLCRNGQVSWPALDFSQFCCCHCFPVRLTSQQRLSLAKAIPVFKGELGSYLKHTQERRVEVSENGEG